MNDTQREAAEAAGPFVWVLFSVVMFAAACGLYDCAG